MDARLQANETRSADLMDAANEKMRKQLDDRLAAIQRGALQRWIQWYGGIEVKPGPAAAEEFAVWLNKELITLETEYTQNALRKFEETVHEGYLLGYRNGLQSPLLDELKVDVKVTPPDIGRDRDAFRKVLRASFKAARALTDADGLATAGFSGVLTGIAQTGKTSHRTKAAIDYHTVEAVSKGVTDVAVSQGLGTMWVSERDACVHCLAYAGEITTGRAPFPAGLTFGAKPLNDLPVNAPPLHGHCRCQLDVVDPETAADASEALKREAKRSILKGYSLPGEPEKTRLDAAERLLTSGGTVNKSVDKFAEKAIKKGEFPTREAP